MGRGLLPCFPALDLGGNDPFSVLLLDHAWGEGDVPFAPLSCGESGPGGLFSWLVSCSAAAYSPAAAQASAARRRHPQLRRGPSLPRRLAGPASSNAGPAFPFWPPPKPFRAAAFLRLALFDGASPASVSLALSRKGAAICLGYSECVAGRNRGEGSHGGLLNSIDTLSAFSVGMELFAALVAGLLLIACFLEAGHRHRATLYFMGILALRVVLLVCDAALWVVSGTPGREAPVAALALHRARSCLMYQRSTVGAAA